MPFDKHSVSYKMAFLAFIIPLLIFDSQKLNRKSPGLDLIWQMCTDNRCLLISHGQNCKRVQLFHWKVLALCLRCEWSCTEDIKSPTCSFTEARMAEVVSVSDPSPLEAFSPGLSMVAFSASAGCSGTGMISGEGKTHLSATLRH